MENMPPTQSVLEEFGPVEVLVSAELQVNEYRQYNEDTRVHCVFFIGHSLLIHGGHTRSEHSPN